MVGFWNNSTKPEVREEKMGLTNIITKIIEDSDKIKNTSETWDLLKKKLKKNGYKEDSAEYDNAMGEISLVGAYKILEVWEALDKHVNKNGNKWGGYSDNRRRSINMMRKVCEIDNIKEVIKALGETGYDSLEVYGGDVYTYVYLSDKNLETFKMFAEKGLYKKYSQVFNAFKKLGYKDIRSYDTSSQNQLDYLVEISKLNGEPAGAIYALASNGYQIDQVVGVSKRDVQNIKQIIEEAQNEKGGISVYLYEKGILEMFKDYFNNLSGEDKKTAMGLILDHEDKESSKGMEEIQKWLEENHKDILTEAGLF
jgi:hypothetical protein